jgi:hypothetical protein
MTDLTAVKLLRELVDSCEIEDDEALCNGAGDAHWIRDEEGVRHYLTGGLIRAALAGIPTGEATRDE